MYIQRSSMPRQIRSPYKLTKRMSLIKVPIPWQRPSWTIHGASKVTHQTGPEAPLTLSRYRQCRYTYIQGPASGSSLDASQGSRAVHSHRDGGDALPFQQKSVVDTRRLKGLRLMILAQHGIPVPPPEHTRSFSDKQNWVKLCTENITCKLVEDCLFPSVD